MYVTEAEEKWLSRLTTAEKEAYENEWLDFLMYHLDKVVPADPVAAVVDLMIEQRDFAPLDLIAASHTDRQAWDALQLLLRRVRRLFPQDFSELLPLALWALDAADGTRKAPKRGPGRPPKIDRVDRPVLDLIEASSTEPRAWDELQFLLRQERAQLQHELAQLPPLIQWALDAADGTRKAPKRKRSRPSKGHALFRNKVIRGVMVEMAKFRLRPVSSGKSKGDHPTASISHLIAAKLHQEPKSIDNMWDQPDRRNRK